jgi:recombination protein RecT
VFKSIRKLAAAGLVPDGREAALVPFKGSCTAIPMVFGLIKMARRSGDVRDIRAHTIYEKDDFEYVVGDEERLTHKPVLFGDKGEPIAYYAIAILKDGTIVRTFMDTHEIERIRKGAASQRGSAQPQGIWKDHYEQMAHKTVIRRLVKRLDLSAEDMRHITMDDDDRPIRDVTPEPEAPPKERVNLAQRIQNPEPEGALDGEVMPPEDDSQAGPDDTSLEYAMGQTAARDGASLNECPYEQGTQEWLDWAGGWNAAKESGDE